MFKRIFSALLGFPVLAIAVFCGGMILKIGLIVLSVIGLYEFLTATNKGFKCTHLICYLFSIIYILFIEQIFKSYMFLFLPIFILAVVSMMVLYFDKISISDVTISIFGFFYVTFLFGFIYLTDMAENGNVLVWFVFICAWVCDTAAYFTGITFGKHPLTKKLSPKKTVEGSIGGILVTGIISYVFGVFVNAQEAFSVSPVTFMVVGIFGSICAQLGDLAASAFKRYANIKDFGNLIPGHGGILDRFDSVLFAAPVVYVIITLSKLLK